MRIPKREIHQVRRFLSDIPIEDNFIEDLHMIFNPRIGTCNVWDLFGIVS